MNKKTLAGIVGVGALMTGFAFGKTYETSCRTFRGFSNISDGERVYKFGGEDPVFIFGDAYILERDSLKINESYIPKIRNPILGQDRLVSATPCEDSSQ